MFQKVNQNCLGLITKAPSSDINGTGDTLDWYFPCNIYNQFGTSGVNYSEYESSTNCHIGVQSSATLKPLLLGQVYYTWVDVADSSRNLAVFEE
jgi:chitin synthase